jgi:hypothetical protein
VIDFTAPSMPAGLDQGADIPPSPPVSAGFWHLDLALDQ